MLSIPVDKDVYSYQPQRGGFNPRVAKALAVSLPVSVLAALYVTFILRINPLSEIGLLSVLVPIVPIFMIALWKTLPDSINPTDLEFEEWLPLFLEQRFGTTEIFYVSTAAKMELISHCDSSEPNFEHQAIKNIKGVELYRPTDYVVVKEQHDEKT